MLWRHVIQEMFFRQLDLMRRFAPIEGLPSPEQPMDMTLQVSQDVARKLAWHVTEELSEAANAGPQTEVLGELTDAFHYMVELCIYVGITPLEIFNLIPKFPVKPNISLFATANPQEYYWGVTNRLGRAMQCLKLRPWRTVTSKVDMDTFRYQIQSAFFVLTELWAWQGQTDEDLYDHFCTKARINNTRLDHAV